MFLQNETENSAWLQSRIDLAGEVGFSNKLKTAEDLLDLKGLSAGWKTLEITREQFLDYEAVRLSGVINMSIITIIEELTELSREQIFEIRKRYDELKKKYVKREWKYSAARGLWRDFCQHELLTLTRRFSTVEQ